MGDLETTFRGLVDDPPVGPAPLEQLERRATTLRRRRYAINGVMAVAAAAVIGYGGSLLLPPGPDVIGPGPDGSSPTPSEEVTETSAPTPTPSPTATATQTPTAPAGAPADEPTAGPTTPVGTAPPTAANPPLSYGELWFNDAGRQQWQRDNGRDGFFVPVYFVGEADDPFAPGAQPRLLWWLEGDEASDLSREEFLRVALQRQTTTPPDGFANGLEGERLELLRATEGTILDLDFSAASFSRGNYGSTGGQAALLQLRALISRFYFDHDQACIRLAGEPTDADGPYIRHDTPGCPLDLR